MEVCYFFVYTEVRITVSTEHNATVTQDNNTPAVVDVPALCESASTPTSDTTATDDSVNTTTAVPNKGQAESQLVSRMLLNDNKAGMEGLDREKINQIIYEASKGIPTEYFEPTCANCMMGI